MCAVEKRRLALRVSLALLATIVGLGAGCGRREESSPADLIKTLKDHKEPDMRAWAARELGRVSGKDAAGSVAALVESLQDTHADVRMAAAYGLADLGTAASAARPALQKASHDAAAQVRTAAAYALKQISPKKRG